MPQVAKNDKDDNGIPKDVPVPTLLGGATARHTQHVVFVVRPVNIWDGISKVLNSFFSLVHIHIFPEDIISVAETHCSGEACAFGTRMIFKE